MPADQEPSLAARRSRNELAVGHQMGVGGIGKPLPALDEFPSEVRQVRDRTAEGGQSKLSEDA